PVTIQAADAVRRVVEKLEGTHRLLLHGRVNPNQAGDIEAMDELAEKWRISAWKTYTQWGPQGRGYFLTDPVGVRFIEKARALGSTWRFLMRDPEQAAHVIGKLVKHCGPDNVLWGTDSIWYGSPQDQIQAFRTFQIAPRLRERHGYAEMTPELRAKIFGLNAAKVYGLSAAEIKKYTSRDRLAHERLAYLENPQPHFRTYGPKTRREFLRYLRERV